MMIRCKVKESKIYEGCGDNSAGDVRRAFGARVQRGRLTALRAEGCGRLSAAGYVRFAQGATAPTALKVVDCPYGQ